MGQGTWETQRQPEAAEKPAEAREWGGFPHDNFGGPANGSHDQQLKASGADRCSEPHATAIFTERTTLSQLVWKTQATSLQLGLFVHRARNQA